MPKSNFGPSKMKAMGGGLNPFLDNYIRLMCISAPERMTVTLFCPNFKLSASALGLKLAPSRAFMGSSGGSSNSAEATTVASMATAAAPTSSGSGNSAASGFTLHVGVVAGRKVRVVSGMCSQQDMHLLFNEAALNAETHHRPILVGAAGEGTMSEVLSIQAVHQGVCPIYSPRYDYQEQNFLRYAALSGKEEIIGLVSRIMKLHLLPVEHLEVLWADICRLQRDLRELQTQIQWEWNFLNLLAMRMNGNI